MDKFLEILLVLSPALLLALTVGYLIKKYLDQDLKRKSYEIRKENYKITLPLRLQSYERLVIFLERISPENLLQRFNYKNISSRKLHSELLKVIRSEYEHNLSQQLYVSSNAWQMVKSAKEEMIKIINITASKVKDDSPAIEYSKKIMEFYMSLDKSPTQIAINALKTEARKIM